MTRVATYLRVPAVLAGLAVAIVGVTLATAAWWGVRAPAVRAHDAAHADLARIATERAALDRRQELSARYADLGAEADILAARLEAGAERSALVRRFTDLSTSAGTRIIHGANNLGRPREGIVPVLQDLTVEGSYTQVRRFLQSVTALDTLTVPVEIDLSANADGTLVRGNLRFMTLSRDGT